MAKEKLYEKLAGYMNRISGVWGDYMDAGEFQGVGYLDDPKVHLLLKAIDRTVKRDLTRKNLLVQFDFDESNTSPEKLYFLVEMKLPGRGHMVEYSVQATPSFLGEIDIDVGSFDGSPPLSERDAEKLEEEVEGIFYKALRKRVN